MRILFTTMIMVLLLTACQETPSYEKLVSQFQKEYKVQFVKKEQAVLTIFTPQKIAADLAFCNKYIDRFKAIQEDDFPFGERGQLVELTLQVVEKKDRINSFLTYPDRYDVRRPLMKTLENDEWSLNKKLGIVQEQLSLTNRYYTAAKHNLQKVQEASALNAIQLHKRTYFLLDKELPKLLAQTTWEEERRVQFLKELEKAKLAVKDYVGYCRSLAQLA